MGLSSFSTLDAGATWKCSLSETEAVKWRPWCIAQLLLSVLRCSLLQLPGELAIETHSCFPGWRQPPWAWLASHDCYCGGINAQPPPPLSDNSPWPIQPPTDQQRSWWQSEIQLPPLPNPASFLKPFDFCSQAHINLCFRLFLDSST